MNEEEEPQSQSEKRRYLREPIIVFKVTEDTQHQPLFGYAKNISRGGFFVASINPREPGDIYRISFQIPNTDIIVRCQCEVVWARKYSNSTRIEPGYGVRFTDITEDIAVAIDNWVSGQRK